MHSLRIKILATTAVLVLVSQVGTVSSVLYTAKSDVAARASIAMESGADVLRNATRSRASQLGNTVQALASDYGFKQAVGTLDTSTIASALQNHAIRAGADVAFVLDTNGQMIAATDATMAALEDTDATGLTHYFSTAGRRIHVADTGAFEVFTVPVRAPLPIAWLSLGFRMDNDFMRHLHDLSGLDVTLMVKSAERQQILATSRGDATGDDLLNTGRNAVADGETITIDIAGQPYLVSDALVTQAQPDIRFLLTKSLAEAMAPYELLRSASLALGMIPLLAALLGAYLLSRALTQPVAKLMEAVRRIRSGDYGPPVDIRSGDELSEFGTAFNAMQSEIAARETRIVQQARQDSVTGLNNGVYALELLQPMLNSAREQNRSVGLLVVRLGTIGELAASLGHEQAQLYLQESARRLQRFAEEDYILARLENDDFLVACAETRSATIRDTATDLLELFGHTIRIPAIHVNVNPVVGAAVFPDHAGDPETLLLRAIVALNAADTDARPIRFYREGDHEIRVRNLRLLQDLQRAADEDEFQLYCQPKIRLADETVCGAEALVRWQHPEHGFLSPGDFIPLIESSGNTGILTRWVVRTAAAQLAEWQQAGLAFTMAINLSSNDLTDDELPWHIVDMVRHYNLDPARLTLEVTEEAMVADFAQANSTLLRLNELGFTISIDDFGTGYSSLAQLKHLPAQELKIDRAFVENLPGDDRDSALVMTTVELARRLGLRTVAEGVTDSVTMNWLQTQGVDTAQGFYWSEPLPAGEFADWAADFNGGSTTEVPTLKLV